jgi:hypothetical protein
MMVRVDDRVWSRQAGCFDRVPYVPCVRRAVPGVNKNAAGVVGDDRDARLNLVRIRIVRIQPHPPGE